MSGECPRALGADAGEMRVIELGTPSARPRPGPAFFYPWYRCKAQ